MGNRDPSIRLRIAELATTLYDGQLTYEEFLHALPDLDRNVDEEVTELLDLIEHHPARGRVLGLAAKEHDAYVADIRSRIARLSG
jgi:hypothetical protein